MTFRKGVAARRARLRAYAHDHARRAKLRVFESRVWLKAAAPVAHIFGHKPVLRYVEMHLVDHCNLNCRGCSHYSPLSPQRFADPGQAERDFARLAELFARVDVVRLMGGEPLLHPHLDRFVLAAREHLPASDVVLVTNGLLLLSQPDSFWELLAGQRVRLHLSRYPVDIDTARIRSRAAEQGVAIRITGRKNRFTMVPVAPEGAKDPGAMRRLCGEQLYCPFLRDGAIYPCARLAMSGLLADRFGTYVPITSADRVVLGDARDGYEVLRLLATGAPWCRFCGSDVAVDFDWAVTHESPDEWILTDPVCDLGSPASGGNG